MAQGEPGDALYIIASGKVEVLAGDEGDDIAARRLAQLKDGETFGEMAEIKTPAANARMKARMRREKRTKSTTMSCPGRAKQRHRARKAERSFESS